LKISVFGPVKNEADYIGYSIMAVLPHVHEIIYTCAKSEDGTDELLDHIKGQYAGEKLRILRKSEYDFNPHDQKAYNRAYNDGIDAVTGEAAFFLHPDMICLKAEKMESMPKATAWWTNITSFAGDHSVTITKGRATRWKNIHAKKMGLHYFGEYGSQNEDMYHRDITGAAHVHHGEDFKNYPFPVKDSGLFVNHYCEAKSYKRRFEKMKTCLKTLYPHWDSEKISSFAARHPRVSLESESKDFGYFEFKKQPGIIPDVFIKYKAEFDKVLGR
jgi:hypothetical protein